jgi:hypothetical protein
MKTKSNWTARTNRSRSITWPSIIVLGVSVLGAQALPETPPASPTNQPPQRAVKTVLQAMREAGHKPLVVEYPQSRTAALTTQTPRSRITVLQALRQRYGEDGLRKWVRVKRH